MASAVFTCVVQQDPCPIEAQQRLDFVGFALGPDCYAIFVVVFVSTVLLNMFGWKIGRVLSMTARLGGGR